MTTIYKPVLIKSAEQAEALPIGTIIECTAGILVGVAPHRKVASGEWFGGSGRRFSTELHIETSNPGRCEWSALVPIEAEEEHQDIDSYEASGHMRRHHLTRYTTPWEEA